MSKPTVQQQNASDPRHSVWVSASAGTGKTRVLVNRMLRLLLDGNRPEKLLCITFTKAAAAEVLQRIQEIVLEWSILNEGKLKAELETLLDRAPKSDEIKRSRRLLPIILQSPGGMKIMTIHAFCQSVLSRFPLEAEVIPGFSVADEAQSQNLLNQAKDQLLEETTQATNAALFADLSRFFDRVAEDSQNNLIQNVLLKRFRLNALLEFHNDNLNAIKETICHTVGITVEQLTDNCAEDFLRDIPRDRLLQVIPELLQGKGVNPGKRAAKMQEWVNNPQAGAKEYTEIYLTQESKIHFHLLAGLDKVPSWVFDFLNSEAQRSFDYIQTQNKIDLALDSFSLLHICLKILDHYQALKKQHSVLDYEDQVLLTAQLLKNPLDSQWVHYKLDGGIDHILVDEAQDTSPAQWEIIIGITEDFFAGSGRRDVGERSLFVVGDEKQSIFSFQNADPVEFSRARAFLAGKAASNKTPWQDIALIDNFRSAPLILQLTDQVFSNPAFARYISHHEIEIKHQAFHALRPAQIELWPLVPLQDDDHYTSSPEYLLSETIADHVKNLLGQRLSNGEMTRPGDIMILVRKRHPLVGPLTKAFKDRNIPVTSADRLILRDQLAVQDCLMAIQACLHQHDDYALACFLKSPFIGMDEAQLYKLSINRPGSLWERFINSGHTEMIDYVQKLSGEVSQMLPGHFIHALLSQPCPSDTRSGRHSLIKRLGYDCDDVLDELLITAYNFEDNQNASAQAFVTWLQSSASVIKRANSELDKSRVQIMTVHAAKGLQGPIVILADSNAKPENYSSVREVIWNENAEKGFLWGMGDAKENPAFLYEKQRHTELQFSEYYRLLYVAMTRAEEHLILCGWEKKAQSHRDYPSWYDSVTEAVGQLKQDQAYQSLEVQRFGQSGLLLSQAGEVEKSSATSKANFIRTPIPEKLLAPPEDEAKRLRPLRPSRAPEQEPSVFSPLQQKRHDSYRRGSILHTLFRLVPDYPPDEQEEALYNLLRYHIEDETERKSMAAEVLKVLHDKEFAHLFTPAAKAEVPVVGEVEMDGQIYAISGQIDRLLIEKDRVLIVDYKTNRPPVLDEAKIPVAYRYQLRAYKRLLQKIYPDKKIETALLWTSIPYLLPVSG